MTKEERHLWYDFLLSYPIRFLRQKVIDNYIVDFYCHEPRLTVGKDKSVLEGNFCYGHCLKTLTYASMPTIFGFDR